MTFSDAQHGQRGGNALHAVATDFVAGFMSPEGHTALANLSATMPLVYRSDWFNVAANQLYQYAHGLGRAPDFVQIWYRYNLGYPALVNQFAHETGLKTGCSIQIIEDFISLRTGDYVWSGQTQAGYERQTTGQYQIRAIAYGNG